MKVEIEIGEAKDIAVMSSHAAAAHVRGLVEKFETDAIALIDSIREAQTTGIKRGPAITTTPSCEGCGTAVAPGQRYCVTCAAKPQFQAPPAGRDFGSHPRPAYRDVPAGQVER